MEGRVWEVVSSGIPIGSPSPARCRSHEVHPRDRVARNARTLRAIGIGTTLVMLIAYAATEPAFAQATSPPPDVRPGFSFDVAPYVWVPTINTGLQYPVRGGGTAGTTLSASPGDYIPHLNFAAAIAGEIEYGRFLAFSDFMYVNAGTSAGRITSFDPLIPGSPVQRVLDTNLSLRLSTALWTIGGGYKLIQSRWVDVDMFAGARLLSLSTKTNYSLAAQITRPNQSIALATTGSLSSSTDIWNGIAGFKGSLYIGRADWFGGGRFFVPFYLDVGGGDSNLTWQGSTGIGYRTNRVALSVGYRYLTFQQGANSTVQKLSMGGPIVTIDFKF